MANLTSIVASVVVHSSAAAFSHFGLTLEPAPLEKAQPSSAPERVVARSPHAPQKVAACPERRGATHVERA